MCHVIHVPHHPCATSYTIHTQANVLADGKVGKLSTLPPVQTLQTDPKYRFDWMEYSALDAKVGG